MLSHSDRQTYTLLKSFAMANGDTSYEQIVSIMRNIANAEFEGSEYILFGPRPLLRLIGTCIEDGLIDVSEDATSHLSQVGQQYLDRLNLQKESDQFELRVA